MGWPPFAIRSAGRPNRLCGAGRGRFLLGLLGPPPAASARGKQERQRGGQSEQLNDERGTSAHYISLRIWIRSSSGGWVSNARFSHDPFFEPSPLPLPSPSSAPRSSGDSIHIWAVARVAWWTTALSFLSFSSAEISPGG